MRNSYTETINQQPRLRGKHMNKDNDKNLTVPGAEADDESDMRVTLSMDDGSSVECEILTIFEVQEQNYIALLPVDENDEPNEEGEVYIYRYFEDAEGNPSLENIEDDDEYEAVADKFDELLDESEFEEME